MSVDLDIVGDTGTVTGQIEALDTVPDAHVHVAIYEEPGPRQPHVVRWFPVYREPLTARSTGQTQTVSGTFTVDADWVANDLHAVMFVQNAYSSHGPMVLTGLGPHENNGCSTRAHQDSWWFTSSYGYINFTEFACYGVDKFGLNPAAADIDGDMLDEIISGAGAGAVFGSHVRAWNYDNSGTVTAKSDVSYFAYGTPKYGVNVCCGDIDGDGIDEIVTGAGPGTVYGPHVRGWNYDGSGIEPIGGVSFLAYGTKKWGVNATCGDVDGDGYDEIITGPGPGSVFGPHVRGWNVDGGAVSAISGISFFAFDDLEWGVNVGAGDLDRDGRAEIVAGRGEGPGFNSKVSIFAFDGSTTTETGTYNAFTGSTTRGVNVTVGEFGVDPS